ncbi:IS630 family transposase [Wolbachia endosymbiont of Nasonia oneida]
MKKTFLYRERETQRVHKKVEEINKENLIYIDESGIEDNEFYEYGWSQRGKRLFAPGFKRKRVSIIGALNEGKVKAPWIIDGYCNSEIFDAYVENVLVPVFKPGQTIVLDNASFYKSARTKNLIENIGCKILFLPPYSPDLNPIEKF